MEVKHVLALSPYQELVSHLARLLHRRNIRANKLTIMDVVGPCLTNPRTMDLVDKLGWTAVNWGNKDQYRLFTAVKMNLRFRQMDYFVDKDGVVVIRVAQKKEQTEEESHASTD